MQTRDYRLLHLFMHTVRAGSVGGAARQLYVSAPVISQALSDLEERLACTLVQRGPRRFELTETGRLVFAQAARMHDEAEAAMAMAGSQHETLSGRIKLTLPVELAMYWLPEALTGFAIRHPNLRVEIDASDERVALNGSDIELAIRAEHAPGEELEEKDDNQIDAIPLSLVAPPAMVRKRPLPSIGLNWHAQHDFLESFDRRGGPPRRIALDTTSVVNSAMVALQLSLEGLGACLVMRPAVDAHLREGRLREVHGARHFGAVIVRPAFRDPLPSRAARALLTHLRGEHGADARAKDTGSG